MPIPALDNEGFLPDGIYDCTLAEIRERFGRFNGTDCRERLQTKLDRFVAEAKCSGVVSYMIVNGSYTTAKPEPGDIDLVVVLPTAHDFAADLLPVAYNCISRKRVAKRYGFDILVAAEGSTSLSKYLSLFHEIKGRYDRKKGFLRLTL